MKLEIILQTDNKTEKIKEIEFMTLPGLGDVVTIGADDNRKTYKVMSVAFSEQERKAVDEKGKAVIGMKVPNAMVPYAILVREMVVA